MLNPTLSCNPCIEVMVMAVYPPCMPPLSQLASHSLADRLGQVTARREASECEGVSHAPFRNKWSRGHQIQTHIHHLSTAPPSHSTLHTPHSGGLRGRHEHQGTDLEDGLRQVRARDHRVGGLQGIPSSSGGGRRVWGISHVLGVSLL